MESNHAAELGEKYAAVIISWDMIESIPGLKGTEAAMDAAMKVTEARERIEELSPALRMQAFGYAADLIYIHKRNE